MMEWRDQVAVVTGGARGWQCFPVLPLIAIPRIKTLCNINAIAADTFPACRWRTAGKYRYDGKSNVTDARYEFLHAVRGKEHFRTCTSAQGLRRQEAGGD
jgi:hypothetical protein